MLQFIKLIMKRYVHLGNYRKSTCVTQMLNEKENIHKSIRSIRSLSKSVRKLRLDKQNHRDQRTIQTLQTPTNKSNRYSLLPKIDQFQRVNRIRDRTRNSINSSQEIQYYNFRKALQKKGRHLHTLDLSIDIQLDRLNNLTQNCSKLLIDLSNIQQRRIMNEYRNIVQSSIDNKIIEV